MLLREITKRIFNHLMHEPVTLRTNKFPHYMVKEKECHENKGMIVFKLNGSDAIFSIKVEKIESFDDRRK